MNKKKLLIKKEVNETNKIKIVATIFILLVFVAVSVYIFFENVYPKIKSPITSAVNSSNGEISVLHPNDKISIEFEATNFIGLSLAYGTFSKTDLQGSINYKLTDLKTNKEMMNTEVFLSDVVDNEHFYLEVTDNSFYAEKSNYILEVDFKNMHEDDTLAIYNSNSTAVSTKINNQASDMGFELNLYRNVFMGISILYWGIISLTIIVLFFMFFGILFKKWNLLIIFIVLFIVIATIYSILLPPINVPDEAIHFKNSYWFSNVFFNKFDADKINYRASDYMLYQDNDYDKQITNSINNYYNFYNDFKLFNKNRDIEYTSIPHSYKVIPYFYSPQVLGLVIGRILNLSFSALYLFARFFSTLFFALIMFLSLKKIPEKYRSFFYIISFFPMNLNLQASFSYDAVIIALSFHIICQFIFIVNNPQKISKKDYLLLFIPILLLSPMKGIYISLALFLFMIPKEKFSTGKRKRNIIIISIIAIIIFSIILNLTSYLFFLSSTEKIVHGSAPNYTINYIIENPLSFIKIFFKSVFPSWTSNLFTLIGSHISWHSVTMPLFITIGYIILSSFAIFSNEKHDVSLANRIVCLLMLAFTYFAAYLIMFVGHTPFGDNTIMGVQGRYFLPVFPLLFLILRPKKPIFNKNITSTLFLSAASIAFFSVIFILQNMS